MRWWMWVWMLSGCVPKAQLADFDSRIQALEMAGAKAVPATPSPIEPGRAGVLSGWPDVQSYMRDSYNLQDDKPYAISLVWGYDDGRSQLVWVRSYSAYDREMVEISSYVGREGQLDSDLAVERNMELALGTLARRDDLYRVVYNTPLRGLVKDNLKLYLERIAISADELEKEFTSADEF